MPKKQDVEAVVCDGCGAERTDVRLAKRSGLHYCTACVKRRRSDPPVTIHGRALTLSELETQAKKDKNLSAALEGDTVQDQIKAAKGT